MKFKYQFEVRVNLMPCLYNIPATKRAAKDYIRKNLRSTHMGQWIKQDDGYSYDTTIGRYYWFIKVKVFPDGTQQYLE